ncbi:MAG: DUF4369 domain-containing protein [Bacteroidales bacterium]|nr:DUF4369 domain-containing protein [Bacteroidales bacterium]
MKKTLIVALAALTLFACERKTTFTITGTIADAEHAEGKYVQMYQTIDGMRVLTDSAKITNGVYTFTGSVDAPVNASLSLFDPERRVWIVRTNLILENAKIKAVTDTDIRTRVSGTANNDRLLELADSESAIARKANAIGQELRDAHEAGNTALAEALVVRFREASNETRAKIQKLRVEFIKNNINNAAGQSQLASVRSQLPIDELEKLIAGADRHSRQTHEVLAVVERIEAMRKTAVGQPFVDLTMPDPDGNMISISDFVGTGYLMIDFTGTWCGPCRAGKPAMIETFNRFNSMGFNIIGVWFEQSHDAWIRGMEALNMPDWPQMSDIRMWQSDGARLYAVPHVPYSVLINPDGIIIARSLRGDDLNDKLEERLGR